MAAETRIKVDLEARVTTLHYPGAEGVQFHDAVLVLHNATGAAAENVGLRLHVQQGDAVVMEGLVDLAALGVGTALPAGETARVSVFRALQHHVRGFASKVNLFGYRAALNWPFRIEVEVTTGAGGHESGGWNVAWRPADDDPSRVEVDIAPA